MGPNEHTAALRIICALLLASLFLLGAPAPASAATIIYVKAGAAGANNGTSWANAYKNLQLALTHSSPGQQIWVAKGTHKPTARRNAADPRSVTFALKSGVAMYGGFAGTETQLSQRNVTLNVTALDGDIGNLGGPAAFCHDQRQYRGRLPDALHLQ